MGAPLLTVDATVVCPHGGQGTIEPAQDSVLAGSTVCTEDDDIVIEGCSFTIGTNPSPCVTVGWQSTSLSCTAGDAALLTTESTGLCVNGAGAPQGPVVLTPAQVSGVAT